MKQARGLRNNNPLNIIKSEKINWQGEVKPSTDPNFAQFETLEYGLRAAFKLLRTYYQKCQDGVQVHRTESRPTAASDEGRDKGDVVRHRVGHGHDGVRPHGEATGRAGAFHRPRMADV